MIPRVTQSATLLDATNTRERQSPCDTINYPVQDLGYEHDIVASTNSLNIAEQQRGHRWAFKTKESKAAYENPAKKTLYNFAPELDADVTNTRSHYQKAEEDLGNWDL